jgi:hypothetical protein
MHAHTHARTYTRTHTHVVYTSSCIINMCISVFPSSRHLELLSLLYSTTRTESRVLLLPSTPSDWHLMLCNVNFNMSCYLVCVTFRLAQRYIHALCRHSVHAFGNVIHVLFFPFNSPCPLPSLFLTFLQTIH